MLEPGILTKTLIFVAASAGLVSVASCSTEPNGESLYDGICGIYTETVSQSVSLRDKWGIITARIRDEFPEFYEDNFVHIVNMDADQKYETFKLLEDEVVGSGSWSCPAMESFYVQLGQLSN